VRCAAVRVESVLKRKNKSPLLLIQTDERSPARMESVPTECGVGFFIADFSVHGKISGRDDALL